VRECQENNSLSAELNLLTSARLPKAEDENPVDNFPFSHDFLLCKYFVTTFFFDFLPCENSPCTFFIGFSSRENGETFFVAVGKKNNWE
jgi:hypothetical protein